MMRTTLVTLVVVFGVFGVFGASSASAQPRTLRWTRLAVTAHLDADGRLHVQERHAIVFDGDWNGGERRFRGSLEDVLHLGRISRIDESGELVPLHEDKSLAGVDAYAWTDSTTLRWRSRLPSDPPFQHREITYVLDYTDSYILIPADGAYLLDHNFGLPDLEWPIDAHSVDLSLDPVWHPLDIFPSHLERFRQPRGDNVTVTARLGRTGATLPAAVNFGAPQWLRYALLALLLAVSGFHGRQFLSRERALGRFEPLEDPASIDRPWLDKHLLAFPPEVVGALWDNRTKAAEVAAVIARLAQEKKLSSKIEKDADGDDELVLTLHCRKESLEGYDATLVKALFVDGDTTSTSQIKAHYKKSGFDPVEKIRKPLRKRMDEAAGRNGAPKIDRAWTVVYALAGVALLAWGGATDALNVLGAFFGGFIVLALYLAGLIGAIDYRRRLSSLGVRSVQFVPALLLVLAVPGILLLRGTDYRFDAVMLAGLVLISLAAVRSILNLAKSRDGGDRLQNRRRLMAARNYFVQELRKPNPALEDDWFPYVLAFGLGANADHWFRSFGGDSSSRPTFDSGSGSTWGSTSSGGSRWTGFAGGASGGAGASGAWAVAATDMAAGVSSPSSSGSGGGGGGGGGGSSGGGGGGGW
jgi:uncharacterized membrane protein YgcG